MKHLTKLILFLSVLSTSFCTYGIPQFTAGKSYRIVSMYKENKGGVIPGTSYTLEYNDNAGNQTLSAFWYIKEVGNQTYTIQNAQTKQYVKYAPGEENRNNKNILFDNAQNDDYTLFKMECHATSGLSYYVISPLVDEWQALDLRFASPHPVGTSGKHGNNNQQFLFIDTDGNVVSDSNNTGDKEVEEYMGPLFKYLRTLTFNGKPIVYDSYNNCYMFSVPLNQMDKNIIRTVEYECLNSAYKLHIDSKTVNSESDFTFENVTAQKEYVLQIYSGTKELFKTSLTFTGLPIVQLYSDSRLSSYYTPAHIRVIEPDKNIPEELYNANIRYRGASAQGYPKKSYAIKLKDADGQKMHKSFFGLREDNNWILDAMAVDRSRMRNRVSTDLWNDFSTSPHYKALEPNAQTATHGQYVEVFFNNEYIGLYCMTEKVDRKQLKLKKYDDKTNTIRGVLYKSSDWTYSTLMGYVPDKGFDPGIKAAPAYHNSSETWNGYEVKYPDMGDGEPIDWKPLYDAVSFSGLTTKEELADSVSEYFDLPIWTDYYLFIELLLASDNHGKNAYFYVYDKTQSKKVGISPWDLDGTFGRRWEGSSLPAAKDFTQFIVSMEHGEHFLYLRLKKYNIEQFNDKLKARYQELRDSYFDPASLINRFTVYKEMFDKSGAAARETARWSNYYGMPSLNFDEELNYLTKWINQRTEYLDQQYQLPLRPTPKITVDLPTEIVYGDGPITLKVTSENTESEIIYSLAAENVLQLDQTNTKLTILKSGYAHLKIFQQSAGIWNSIDTTITIPVMKKDLYIIADDKERDVDTNNPTWTIRYEGLVNGDRIENILSTLPTAQCEATVNAPVGSYPIVVNGGTLKSPSNYKLIRQNGTLNVVNPMSINENDLSDAISIYPNPVTDLLTITNNCAGTCIQLYGADGTLRYQNISDSDTHTIDMTPFERGIYYLRIGIKSYPIMKR